MGIFQTKTKKIDSVWLTKELEKFPDAFKSIKDAILLGNGYWYPFAREYEPEQKTAVYNLDKIYKNGGEGIGLLKEVFSRAGINYVKAFHPYCYEGQSTWLEVPDIKDFLYEKDESVYNFNWINEEYYSHSPEASSERHKIFGVH